MVSGSVTSDVVAKADDNEDAFSDDWKLVAIVDEDTCGIADAEEVGRTVGDEEVERAAADNADEEGMFSLMKRVVLALLVETIDELGPAVDGTGIAEVENADG